MASFGSTERVVPESAPRKPNINRERFQQILEIPVSQKYLWQREKQRKILLSIQKAERMSREEEKKRLGIYELALGIATVKKSDSDVLNDEQKAAVLDVIKSTANNENEQRAMRETFFGSYKDQAVFISLYHSWKEDWESNEQLRAKMTFKDYARLKGIEYIREYAKQVRKTRADLFYNANRDITGMTPDQIKQEQDKLRKALDLFFQANSYLLAELNSLEAQDQQVKRKALLKDFMVVMAQNGFDKIDQAQIESLFEQFVGDFEHEYASLQEFEATYEEMLEAAELGLSPEEWEKRRKDALKKNATGELQEYLRQQIAPVYVGQNEAVSVAYDSIGDVANACGVHFERAGSSADTYVIKAPAVADNSFAPLLQIVFDPPDSRQIKDAKFLIQQPWQDEDSSGMVLNVGGKPAVAYGPQDVIRGVNVAILDHIMNKKINIVLPENAKQGTNRLIRENLMVHFAERLLSNFRVGDRSIREDEIATYQRFMEVVLRNDPDKDFNSLQKRVQKAWEMLDNNAVLPVLQEIFSKPGATVMTLSALNKEIEVRREGKKS